jgi:hypothetical protein
MQYSTSLRRGPYALENTLTYPIDVASRPPYVPRVALLLRRGKANYRDTLRR